MILQILTNVPHLTAATAVLMLHASIQKVPSTVLVTKALQGTASIVQVNRVRSCSCGLNEEIMVS